MPYWIFARRLADGAQQQRKAIQFVECVKQSETHHCETRRIAPIQLSGRLMAPSVGLEAVA